MNIIWKILLAFPLCFVAYHALAESHVGNSGIEVVHPNPKKGENLPYSPGILVTGNVEMLYLAGSTASPLYHKHPHDPQEHSLPSDIEEQTRRAMNNIKRVLDAKGASFKNVVMVTKYLTDMREADAMHRVMAEYFQGWKPASTLVEVNNLSSPSARVEIEMVAAIPRHNQ